jgi:hypothetical protein
MIVNRAPWMWLSGMAVAGSALLFGSFPSSQNAYAEAVQSLLVANVGAAGGVALLTRDGTRVVSLGSGAYTIVVRDRSSRHNFHLVGPDPSLDSKTGVKFVGTVRWKFTFLPGVYRYYSDVRPSARRSFRVVR